MNFFKRLFQTSQPKEKPSHTDYNIIFDNNIVDRIPIEVLEIGDLHVPSGKIVACDPLAIPDMPPFEHTVSPGKYPIKIYIAKLEDWGDRYAIAKLEFTNDRADKWVLALREGETLADLKNDEFLGFPVDAGLGGFFDYEVGKKYEAFTEDFYKKNPDGNIYDDLFAAEFKKNASNLNDLGDWINYYLPDCDNCNITMFHSGFGDGYYPCYWGITKDNKICSLVIDFHVLLSPDE